jgi:hypothetical protein
VAPNGGAAVDHFLFWNTENRTKSLPKKQKFGVLQCGVLAVGTLQLSAVAS